MYKNLTRNDESMCVCVVAPRADPLDPASIVDDCMYLYITKNSCQNYHSINLNMDVSEFLSTSAAI